jgi:AcrR family transcriptional regulator
MSQLQQRLGSTGERRSHAERSATTRAKIIAAVLESIAEIGFQRTTASEITRRAGVTWGAVQHHFGAKDGILRAVLEDSFERFSVRLEGIPVEGTSLSKRAALFIERAWEHFGSTEYRSTFEILLHYLGREDATGPQSQLAGADATSWQGQMFQSWDRIWLRLFADADITRRRHRVLEHYTIAVLSGLATTLMLEGRETSLGPEELALLQETLARELARGAD